MSNMGNTLSVRPIDDRMNGAELDELRRKLATLGVDDIPAGDGIDVEQLSDEISEAALDEFLDRLKRVGIAAEMFLPVPFAGTLRIRGIECGSAHALLRALDALRSELGLDDDAAARDPRLGKQRNVWRLYRRGAKLAVKKRLLLELVRL